MTWKLASLLALLFFALLALGGSVASAQSPDGASHDRVQQQRAPAACPPDMEWGCVLAGSTTPGLTLNSTSTTNNSYSLYASLNNPGSGSAAVWGRVLGSGASGYGVYGSHQGSGYGVYGFSNNGIGFLGYSNTGTGMQGDTFNTGNRPGILGQHRATTGTGAGVEGRTNSAEGSGVYGVSPHQGVSGRGTGPSSVGIYGSGGLAGGSNTGKGVVGEGFGQFGVGVQGTGHEFGTGVVGFGGTYGVRGRGPTGIYGTSTLDSGTGIYGSAGLAGVGNAGKGVVGEGFGQFGVGVQGTGHEFGTGVVGFGGTYGVRGRGPTGVYGTSTLDSGTGVYGLASVGVEGVSNAEDGVGVRGDGEDEAVGVEGVSRDKYGVHGFSTYNVGVYGQSDSWAGLSGYSISSFGVYGQSGSGYAGWFVGPVRVVGNLEVTGSIGQPAGATRLDHPLDPENQYLSHAFVESPDMKNVYDGNVTLDANGEAVVEMPAYFQALNRDFRYQLTPLGPTTSVLYIAQKIENNRFKIGGGSPGLEVSWQVTGIRQDPWANENRIPVEEPKPADERGTYIYPEGYGQPESRGVNYEEQQRMREMQEDAPLAPAEAPGQ